MVADDRDAVIHHCIACCDGALTDDQRSELYSRIGGLIAAVADECAKRAEYGDCMTGMGCHEGYHPDSIVGVARKRAADDIRAMYKISGE